MLSAVPEGTILKIRVVPGARKSELAGEAAGRLKVRLMAPPVEGKANRELVRFLAARLGLKKNRLSLTAGERSREKSILLEGISPDEVRSRLKTALGEA